MATMATTTTIITTTTTRTGAGAPSEPTPMATTAIIDMTDLHPMAGIEHPLATGTTTQGIKTTDPDLNKGITTMATQDHITTRDLATAQQAAEIRPLTGETTEVDLAMEATTTMGDL